MNLGIPKDALVGSEYASTAVSYEEYVRVHEARIRNMYGEKFAAPFVAKCLEQSFPEMFFEPFFLFSHGRAYVRRRVPVKFQVKFDADAAGK